MAVSCRIASTVSLRKNFRLFASASTRTFPIRKLEPTNRLRSQTKWLKSSCEANASTTRDLNSHDSVSPKLKHLLNTTHLGSHGCETRTPAPGEDGYVFKTDRNSGWFPGAVLSLNVVGLSFENRQKIVKKLKRGETLLLVREPTNEFDPNAIMVQRLDGNTVGYVPAELTNLFLFDVTFAIVTSVGPNDKGILGVKATCKPASPSLDIDVLPRSQWETRPSDWISAEAWKRLEEVHITRVGHRCEVCGVSGDSRDIHCAPRWSVHSKSRTQRLCGLLALCSPCSEAKSLLKLYEQGKQGPAILHLMKVNDWDKTEARAYIQHIFRLFSARQGFCESDWKVDASWLSKLYGDDMNV